MRAVDLRTIPRRFSREDNTERRIDFLKILVEKIKILTYNDMKKITFIFSLLLFFVTAVFANIEINETNFPDENFRAILHQDYGNNGIITDAVIANTTFMFLSRGNISDLTGIEFFTNLETLYCHYNRLTSLNISGLTKLKVLYCNNNNLTSLDVSSLTNLEQLSCHLNPELALLNVSGLTKLKQLSCHMNRSLTSLNVSGLTSLQVLLCHENQLTSLNVSNLPNLKELHCWDNHLTSLNLSGLTNLIELRCETNRLTSLDVSELTSITDLICSINQLTSLDVSSLVNLKTLCCNNNLLTSLEVSGLTNLENLLCSQNQLTSLYLLDLNNIKYLDCSDNQLKALNISGLTNIGVLQCNYNQLTSLDVSSLVNLTELSCEEQTPTLTLVAENGVYSIEIALNNPSGFIDGISYENCKLLSMSNRILESNFEVNVTGFSTTKLSGTLRFEYNGTLNLLEGIKNKTTQAVGFYSVMGIKLEKEPQNGLYIVVYDNGMTENKFKKK